MLKYNITRTGGSGARAARPKAKRDYGAGADAGEKEGRLPASRKASPRMRVTQLFYDTASTEGSLSNTASCWL